MATLWQPRLLLFVTLQSLWPGPQGLCFLLVEGKSDSGHGIRHLYSHPLERTISHRATLDSRGSCDRSLHIEGPASPVRLEAHQGQGITSHFRLGVSTIRLENPLREGIALPHQTRVSSWGETVSSPSNWQIPESWAGSPPSSLGFPRTGPCLPVASRNFSIKLGEKGCESSIRLGAP